MIIFREEKDEDDLRDFKGAARGMAIGSVILGIFDVNFRREVFQMRRFISIGLILVFLIAIAGCATPHISGRTTQGALIGGAIGAIAGGEKGAYIGAALGAGLAHIIGTEEEMTGRTLVPVDSVTAQSASMVGGHAFVPNRTGYIGYGEIDCSIFSIPDEQAECERGKRAAESKLRRELKRRAYEYGRYGY
ncbi:hypothetical protein KKD04_00120 [Patescibacteria group bacterium]|nr:hypothetical protein [Patescibacteria group bacterium]